MVGDCRTTKITVAKCNKLVAFEIAVDVDRVCNWQAVAIFKTSAILLLGCSWTGSVFVIIRQLTVSSWWKSQICFTLHPQKFIIKQKFKDFFSNTDLYRYITRIQPDGKRVESSPLLQKQVSWTSCAYWCRLTQIDCNVLAICLHFKIRRQLFAHLCQSVWMWMQPVWVGQ